MKKRFLKNKGILFWLTGVSGSGKSSLGKNIKKEIINLYGPTLLINGDNLRKIFKLYDYSTKGRLNNGLKFIKLAKFITDQKINIIFCIVGMFHRIRNVNKKNIKNYLEIYIKADINKIIRLKKKNVYLKKRNVIGVDLIPEYPESPDIILKNNFDKNIKHLSNELIKKIKSKINFI
jgi:adenylylsulfate kinase